MRPLPEPAWCVVENALVVPPLGAGRPALGVFDGDGRFVKGSATLLSHGRLSHMPKPDHEAPPAMRGLHFFAGLGRAHFGHFLLESAVRLWALPDLPEAPESAIFTPLPKADLNGALKGPLREVYAGLAGGSPFQSIKAPTRFERLVVANPGFGHGDWIAGTDAFRRFIAARFADEGPFAGPERLYISRSALGAPKQRVDQEEALEAALSAGGYTIFHPQAHDLGTQIERYRAARVILGGDGSAFHLLAFVAQSGTRIGLIQRRNRPEVIDLLSRQIAAFSGIVADAFDATLPLEAQRKLVPEGANAPTPLDLGKLLASLRQRGYL